MKKHTSIQIDVDTESTQHESETREAVNEMIEQMRNACREIAAEWEDNFGWKVTI